MPEVTNLEPRVLNVPKIPWTNIRTLPADTKIFIKPGLELPVTELMEVVDFVTALANAIAKFTVGGANIFTGAFAFIPVVPKAIKAVGGLSHIPSEIKFMTPKQKDELIKVIEANLTFTEDVKKIVGVALDIAFGLKTLISLF